MPKLRILIVDDHNQFVKAFKYLLEDLFADHIQYIDVVNNGDDCLEILSNRVYDIIFMDVDMPGMNGIDATKIINDTYRDIKIIAVSFHSDVKYIMKMIEAGARNYLIKEEINRERLEKALGVFA
jgi:DNA-binding NarL/FixJ family response regulator